MHACFGSVMAGGASNRGFSEAFPSFHPAPSSRLRKILFSGPASNLCFRSVASVFLLLLLHRNSALDCSVSATLLLSCAPIITSQHPASVQQAISHASDRMTQPCTSFTIRFAGGAEAFDFVRGRIFPPRFSC